MSDDDTKGFKKDSAFKEKEKASSDKSERYSKIKSKINSFAESSEILLKILEDVQGIHPFIGVAVIAFKAVISFELKRRENDDKVMFLLVKIQDMMGILVQLRVIPPDRGGYQEVRESVRYMFEEEVFSVLKDHKSQLDSVTSLTSSSMESYFTRGTRRGRDENDGEETSNSHNDLSGGVLNLNLARLIAGHPRPIAGLGRAYSSNFAVPNSYVAEPRRGEERSAHGPDTSQQVYDSEAQSYVLSQSQISPLHISHDTQYDHLSLPISSEELVSSLYDVDISPSFMATVRKDQRLLGPRLATWTPVLTATKPQVGLVEGETW
ncbi:hypothetical protein PQX77_014710 [Marasmius sp. AFHP31]|nr:hypothetical protein PQX77_014710 [Marasmius sp. AFHP31]